MFNLIIHTIFAAVLSLQPLNLSNIKLLPIVSEIEFSGYQRDDGFFIDIMGKIKDLTGQRFGKLVVLKRDENDKKGNNWWICKCDCGNEHTVIGGNLKHNNTKSCGCNRDVRIKIKDLKQFEEDYHNLTMIELGKKYDINRGAANKYAKKLGFSKKHPRHHYKNHFYFSKENDCANKYYILGLIYTDGNLPKPEHNKNNVNITSMDLDLLESVKKEICYTGKIFKEKKKNLHILGFSSKQIREDLESFGLTPNKTFTLKFPEIPEQYLPDFVRGLWDGDGTVYIGKRKRLHSAFVCASKEFIEDLVKILPVKKNKIYSEYGRGSTNLLYKFSLGVSDSINLRHYMYYNDAICLKRKKDKFYSYVPVEKCNGNSKIWKLISSGK